MMRRLVEQYLQERRSFGFALRTEEGRLRDFAQFADAYSLGQPLSNELIATWATAPTSKERRFPGRRVEAIRPFCRYVASIDSRHQIPPRSLVGPPRCRPIHHIYTDTEIASLIGAARALPPAGGRRAATYATILGLLASTGLRGSEALRLTRSDVDLANGTLTVRATKFRKSRLVPLHSSTTQALRSYARFRDGVVRRSGVSPFFVGNHCLPIPYSTFHNIFVGLRQALGWSTLHPRPRIHDLRHTFVCHRIRDWYAQGVEVSPRLASLATYLGHAHISDTYWYLTASPELLALAASRFEMFASQHPEGGFP